MKAVSDPLLLKRQWKEFLRNTNGSLDICDHLLERVQQRFPEMLEMKKKDFLDLVRRSYPMRSIVFHKSKEPGLQVKNGDIIFVVGLESALVISIYHSHYNPPRLPKAKYGRPPKKKQPYHRHKVKRLVRKALKEIL